MIRNEPVEHFQQAAQLFKALAHPARLALLEVLRNSEECVCHMEAVLGFRQAYLSQQLAVLRETGILQDRREGWNIYYRIVREDVLDILNAIRSTLLEQTQPSNLGKPHECDCPKCKHKNSSVPEAKFFLIQNQNE